MIYYLFAERTAHSLSVAVNDHLAEGWQLYGNPCVVRSDNDDGYEEIYSQAMTKE